MSFSRSTDPSHPPTALTCDEVEGLLPLVADDAVDPDGDPALFAHLAHCTRCQDSLARHDLVSLALARRPEVVPEKQPLRFPVRLLAAAGIAVVLGAAWLVVSRQAVENRAEPIASQPATKNPPAGMPAPAEVAAVPVVDPPRVYRVRVGDPARPLYLIVDDQGSTVVDPHGGDGRTASGRGDAVPVRY